MKNRYVMLFIVLIALAGCGGANKLKEHHVLATTTTVIGVDVSQDPASNQPHGKLGYYRSELALVPTNRTYLYCKDKAQKNCIQIPGDSEGAAKSAEVLMELKYDSGVLNPIKGGIYQRLAVGEKAVGEPGAALMFAKNPEGEIDKNSTDAIDNLAMLERAEKAGYVESLMNHKRIDDIMLHVAPEDMMDNSKLDTLLNKAEIKTKDREHIAQATSTNDLRGRLDVMTTDSLESLHRALLSIKSKAK